MSPKLASETGTPIRFPRTRGDEPGALGLLELGRGFSPHARG